MCKMKKKPSAGKQREVGEVSTKEDNLETAIIILDNEARPGQARRVNAKEIAMIKSVNKVKISHMVYEQL